MIANASSGEEDMDGDFETRILEISKAQGECVIEAEVKRRAGDDVGHAKVLHLLVALEAEALGLLKIESARLTTLLRVERTASDDDKVSQLLQAFALAAKLTRIWADVYSLQKKSTACQFKAGDAVRALDGIGRGRRGDLAVFLDGKDTDAKAMAAGSLFRTMPERCLSILKELSRTERWLSAGRIAVAQLCVYEDLEPSG